MEEDNIQICDVFKGSEADWTKRFTGPRANSNRAALMRSISPEYQAYIDKKKSEAMLKLHSDPEWAKKRSERQTEIMDEYYKNLGIEGWNLRSKKSSETMTRTHARMSPEEKKALNLLLSQKRKETDAKRTPAERIALGLKMSEAQRNIPKARKEACKAAKIAWWNGLSDEEKKVHVSKTYTKKDGVTEPEFFLGLYLKKRFPGEWLYNGQCQAGFVIGGKVPDFVNVNGRKAVVEMFGTYYHPEGDEAQRLKHYASYGYDCTIVWEYDVANEEELDKIFGVTSG